MTLVYKARVWERSAVTGTGTITLPGVAQIGGFQTFNTAFAAAASASSGCNVCYSIVDSVAPAWEQGIGTYIATSNTLSRSTILESSASGGIVTFVGNTCDVTVDYPSPVVISGNSANYGQPPVLGSGGVLDNSVINWGSPGAIGSVTSQTGIFTGITGTYLNLTNVAAIGPGSLTLYVPDLTGGGQRYVWSVLGAAPASATYYQIATLVASSSVTYDHLQLDGVINTGWSGSSNCYIKIVMGNRNGLSIPWYELRGYTASQTGIGITCFNQSSSAVNVYIVVSSGAFADARFTGYGLTETFITSPSGSTTVPSGTMLFDSRSATPNLTVDQSGNVINQGGITSGGGLFTVNSTGSLALYNSGHEIYTGAGGPLFTVYPAGSSYGNSQNTAAIVINSDNPSQLFQLAGYSNVAASAVLGWWIDNLGNATFNGTAIIKNISASGATAVTVPTSALNTNSTIAASTAFVLNTLNSPPSGGIGSTAAAPGFFTNLNATGTVSGAGFASYLNSRAYYQGTAKSPTAPASTTARAMQGLAGAVTPVLTGKILIIVNGTITAPTGTTVNNGILYQIAYGTGTAPANAAASTGTAIGPTQEYTSAIAPTAAADIHVPFSVCAVVALTVGTTYWIDLQAESVTTASAMGLTNVQITAIEQ